jgi:hypothetical protein
LNSRPPVPQTGITIMLPRAGRSTANQDRVANPSNHQYTNGRSARLVKSWPHSIAGPSSYRQRVTSCLERENLNGDIGRTNSRSKPETWGHRELRGQSCRPLARPLPEPCKGCVCRGSRPSSTLRNVRANRLAQGGVPRLSRCDPHFAEHLCSGPPSSRPS